MRSLLARNALAVSLGFALAVGATTAQAQASATTGEVAVAASPARVEAESKRLNAWLDQQYAQWMRFSPLMLSFYGSKELNDQLDDGSMQGMQQRLAWAENSTKAMQSGFDYQLLDADARLSWDLWLRQYESLRDGMPFVHNRYAFDQMNGMQSTLPMLLMNFHKVDSEQDYLAYLSRLEQVPRLFEQLLELSREAAGKGVLPPRFALQGVIEQSRKVVSGAPFSDGQDSALWADLQGKADALAKAGSISQARADSLKAQARSALVDNVQPAYAAVIDWAGQSLPAALENPAGVGTTQANGADYYRYQLRENTTTALSAEQVHQIGLQEVARIRAEMETLKDSTGFKGDLQAFFAHVGSDARFKYANTDAGRQAYIDDAGAAIDNIRKVLPQYFGLLPKAPLEVRRVESFREQPGAAQHYYPGTADGSRPGIYYMHLADMDAMPRTEMEVIAYHEGLPGHHMQISIAQELQGLPLFRTRLLPSAYTEGWGLYSERLAKEMPGTYVDPYSDFGRLVSEMWRAIRLVVDTGLHAKGWTEQQAVDYFRQNSSIPQAAIESEVRRYLIMPGQATSYKIGMIKMLELRQKAETELGERFDIRQFHDTVLGGGAMPLDLLERRVNDWIVQQKAA